jgi:hypothetical protein
MTTTRTKRASSRPAAAEATAASTGCVAGETCDGGAGDRSVWDSLVCLMSVSMSLGDKANGSTTLVAVLEMTRTGLERRMVCRMLRDGGGGCLSTPLLLHGTLRLLSSSPRR